MEFSLLRRIPGPSAEDILYDLTMRQHLKPHRSIGEAVSGAAAALGFCALSAERALEWLRIEQAGAIGQLRRGQLAQLSSCIHRYGRQAGMVLEPGELAGFDGFNGFDKLTAGKLTAGKPAGGPTLGLQDPDGAAGLAWCTHGAARNVQ